MRIEIGAGGISTCSSVYDYQLNMYSFADRVDDVLSCFKMIKAETENLNGGVGNLHEAVNEVSDVIDENSQRQADVKSVRSKTNSFLDLAIRVDQQVAVKVMQNREQFYRVHEWLRPNPPEEEKSFLGQMWDWLCGVGEAVVEGIKEGWNWITDTAKKIWDGLVAFYEENKKIIDTILIAAGAVLAVAAVVGTGGLALAPLLGSIGLSASAAAFFSSAVGVVAVISTIGSSALNIYDIWVGIENSNIKSIQNVLNFVSGVTNIAYNVGTLYNSVKDYRMFRRADMVGYPENAPQPKGYYRLLDGDEYSNARRLANTTNSRLHRMNPELAGLQIHEVHPVKFGGSPDLLTNKLFLTPERHSEFTVFWNNFMRNGSGKPIGLVEDGVAILNIGNGFNQMWNSVYGE